MTTVFSPGPVAPERMIRIDKSARVQQYIGHGPYALGEAANVRQFEMPFVCGTAVALSEGPMSAP